MQNFAAMLNTQNTNSLDDYLNTNKNYDTSNIVEKGKDFFSVLNNKETATNKEIKQTNNKNTENRNEKSQNSQTDKTQNDGVNSITKENKKINRSEEKKQITENTQQTTKEATDKTLDEVKSEPIIKETQETAQGENTQVLDINKVIQNTVDKINNLIETSLDGQLNLEDVKQLKTALEEIQTKINNNEFVVSEETKQMLSDVLDRLLTQNPKDLEVAELQKDLKQLAQDIKANAFKLNSQVKLEEENSNPTKALEINIDNTNEKQTKEISTNNTNNEEKITKKTKDSQTTVIATKETKEVKDTQNTQSDKVDIEQEMLNEMDVRIEEVSDSSTNTNSQNQSYTTAQDEVIKLQIQNTDKESATPVAFTFDNTIKNINTINKPIQVEGATKELNINDILNQIGSKFEQLKDGQSTKITMTLRPNDLGRVTIELLSNANGISTNIIAQNSQVKELLDKNIEILKQQLVQQGINVQNVQVKTVEQNSQAGLNNGYNERQNQQENQGQNQNSRENNQNQQQQHQRRETFKFNQSNIIENVDFESNSQSATASINTLRGKINYNL